MCFLLWLFWFAYFFNVWNESIHIHFWIADWINVIINWINWIDISSHLKIFIYTIWNSFGLESSIFSYNLVLICLLIVSVYKLLEEESITKSRKHKYITIGVILFALILFFNSYWISYSFEFDKPFYVSIYLYSSIIYYNIFLKNWKKWSLVLSILLWLLGIWSYISYIFFLPFYLLCYWTYHPPKYLFYKASGWFVLWIIALIILYNINHTIAHSINGIYYVLFDWWQYNITWWYYLYSLVSKFWLLQYLYLLLIGVLVFKKKSKDVRNTVSLYLFFVVYTIFLFSIQSSSYSTWSRYVYYAIIPFSILVTYWVLSILEKKYTIYLFLAILLNLLISYMYPFDTYFRNLWNPHYELCEVISQYSNKKIAYLEWPSIVYNCWITFGADGVWYDENWNKYYDYWWNFENLNTVQNFIQEWFIDIVIIDYRWSDYIWSNKILEKFINRRRDFSYFYRKKLDLSKVYIFIK
jgi:hypothetical protein